MKHVCMLLAGAGLIAASGTTAAAEDGFAVSCYWSRARVVNGRLFGRSAGGLAF